MTLSKLRAFFSLEINGRENNIIFNLRIITCISFSYKLKNCLKKDYSIKEASHETRSSVTIFFFVRPQKTDRDHPPFVVLDLSSAIDHAV